MRLKNKKAVITGAAAGIGRSAVRLFAAQGAEVLAVDVDFEGLKQLAEEMPEGGGQCRIQQADLTLSEECGRVIDEARRRWGSPDILFNNAGVVHQGPLYEASDEDWTQALSANVASMFRLCRGVVPLMLENGSGSIINTASVAGPFGLAQRGVYSVSKAAVVGLTKSLAADLVDKGIRVNCICPGTVDTPSLQGRIDQSEDPVAARAAFIARQPMGRLGRPGEIAALALYLAEDDSAYMTGQALVIDGGMTL
ncbi:MAG TPA: glucose 1-dehydrogenase [Acidobacteriota bacterium]|nr:glucose 1-dehydrogenase [Acidobacteriota bacterium]